MWEKITSFIIRNRLVCLIGILLVTGFMAYKGTGVKLSYDFPKVIPVTDTDYVYYERFKKNFGQDNDLLIVGFNTRDVFQKDLLNAWYRLGKQMKSLDGVTSVASVPALVSLEKDTAVRRFTFRPIMDREVATQQEADSIKEKLHSLRFYNGLFYEASTHATLMAIKLSDKMMVSKDRIYLIDSVEKAASAFGEAQKVEVHYSGMPYIRTVFTQKMQREINFFLILSILVTAAVLLIFFRSLYAVIFPLGLIGILIAWTLGIIVLLGYKLTLLTGLIPPLITIIAVPNFIYFFTRYHTEYRACGNKYTAIMRMVQRIAKVIFLNNTTTAIGFGVLYFVDSPMLKEFGVVAFTMICIAYLLTLVVMPIVFSYLPAPSMRQIHYLNNPFMSRFLRFVDWLAHQRRKALYAATVVIAIVALFGLTKLHAVGYIMDDIPKEDRLSKDLSFFEHSFKGIMPLDIIIDTKRKNGLLDTDILSKIEQLQDTLEAIPAFASTLSVADVAMYANQAFYNGSPSRYRMPGKRDKVFLFPYLMGMKRDSGNKAAVNLKLWDTSFQQARISTRMADVGSKELSRIITKVDTSINHIFDGEVSYRFTGFSRIFLKGNGYLIINLVESIIMAILLIIVVIAVLFPSVRLVMIVLIPNLLALLITAGVMGYFNIPLKPSSVLVFCISFGIAVDASFHFLVTYRLDLKLHNWDIPKTVTVALRQTGFSIVYTSLVLFFGFGIFCFSNFGSTVSLGSLMSITLLCAMFTNIILIPALLISFDRKGKRAK